MHCNKGTTLGTNHNDHSSSSQSAQVPWADQKQHSKIGDYEVAVTWDWDLPFQTQHSHQLLFGVTGSTITQTERSLKELLGTWKKVNKITTRITRIIAYCNKTIYKQYEKKQGFRFKCDEEKWRQLTGAPNSNVNLTGAWIPLYPEQVTM